jgi:hypothetical protein
MATDLWLLGRVFSAVARLVVPRSASDKQRRQAARATDAWVAAPFEHLLAEARRRVAAFFPANRAGHRLARRDVFTDAELLQLLRALRFQVCRSYAGLAKYEASGLHEILLALRRRQAQLRGPPGPPQGIFR